MANVIKNLVMVHSSKTYLQSHKTCKSCISVQLPEEMFKWPNQSKTQNNRNDMIYSMMKWQLYILLEVLQEVELEL